MPSSPPDPLLSFMDMATSSIRSALHRPIRPRRRVNHRKYLQKQLIRSRNASIPPAERPLRQEDSSHLQKSLDALFSVHQQCCTTTPNSRAPPLRTRNLPESFFVEPRSCSPRTQVSSPCSSVGYGSLNSPESPSSDSVDVVSSLLDLESMLSDSNWASPFTANEVSRSEFSLDSLLNATWSPEPENNSCCLTNYYSPCELQQENTVNRQRQDTWQRNTVEQPWFPQRNNVVNYPSCRYSKGQPSSPTDPNVLANSLRGWSDVSLDSCRQWTVYDLPPIEIHNSIEF